MMKSGLLPALVVAMLLMSVHANEPVWTLRAPGGPSDPTERRVHAMAYDSARGRVVLFGGEVPGPPWYDGETWEWGGSAWALRATDGPSPRRGHAMAYDEAREVVVLFAGYSYDGANSYYGDTWEWDGGTWTLRATTGPSPRAYHALAYDSARGVVVLFGGYFWDGGGFYYNDTWEWDGSTWTQVATDGPSPRYFHAMACDSARSVVVLFGGDVNKPPYYDGETWEWDGNTWTLRSTGGPSDPPARKGHAMAYESERSVMVLFGGRRPPSPYVYYGDTWEWDGSTWTLRTTQGPTPRAWPAMAYDSSAGIVVLFGGFAGTNTYFGDTWDFGVYRLGDFNRDHDVDLNDFALFAACYNGSARPPADDCFAGINADLDGDGDVDLDDFAIFAANYTGAL